MSSICLSRSAARIGGPAASSAARTAWRAEDGVVVEDAHRVAQDMLGVLLVVADAVRRQEVAQVDRERGLAQDVAVAASTGSLSLAQPAFGATW